MKEGTLKVCPATSCFSCGGVWVWCGAQVRGIDNEAWAGPRCSPYLHALAEGPLGLYPPGTLLGQEVT